MFAAEEADVFMAFFASAMFRGIDRESFVSGFV